MKFGFLIDHRKCIGCHASPQEYKRATMHDLKYTGIQFIVIFNLPRVAASARQLR